MDRFVTEEEVHEKRQQRQAEWEKVRKEDDPEECPEEETRSLFEQLQANKNVKDKEFEDESRLRSSVKGLDDDEAQFLNFVTNRQMQLERERTNEEKNLIKELEEAKVVKIAEKEKNKEVIEKDKSRPSTSTTASSNRKSQSQLLSGAIKRKSVEKGEVDPESKKSKVDSSEGKNSTQSSISHKVNSDSKMMSGLPHNTGLPVVAGVLPGIAGYEDGDSSTENSSNSSDSEDDHKVYPGPVTIRAIQDMMKKIKSDCG